MGFLAGAVLGLAWGVLVGLFPLMERLVYPYIVAFQTVPKVAIAPIIVIWFGYGMTSRWSSPRRSRFSPSWRIP